MRKLALAAAVVGFALFSKAMYDIGHADGYLQALNEQIADIEKQIEAIEGPAPMIIDVVCPDATSDVFATGAVSSIAGGATAAETAIDDWVGPELAR